MGRFYRTAKPTFVDDNIYTPPWELATQVLSQVDSDIAENEQNLLAFNDLLQAEALQQDQPRVREIISGYENQINELTQKIQENPLEFRRDTGAIRNLGRDIHENWTRGEIAAIQGNKGTYDAWLKNEMEKTKATKGYVTQEDVNYARQKFLSDFRGTNFQADSGTYDTIYTEALNPFVDLEDLAEERAKGYEADVIKNLGASIGSDGYIRKTRGSREFVSYEEIYKGVYSSMLNDNELMSYYGQQMKLGALTPQQVDAKLNAAASRVANKYSYEKTESGVIDMKASEELKQMHRKQLVDYRNELKNPQKSLVYTSRTKNPIEVKEAKKRLNTPTASFEKAAEDAWAKVRKLKSQGNSEDSAVVKDAIQAAQMAELDLKNLREQKATRAEDYDAYILNKYGKNSPEYKMYQKLGWEGMYDLNKMRGYLKDQAVRERLKKDPKNKNLSPQEFEELVQWEWANSSGGTRNDFVPIHTQRAINDIANNMKGELLEFRDEWAEDYATSHTTTDYYIDTTSKTAKYYKDLGNQLLSGTGNIQFLNRDLTGKDNDVKNWEIETSAWGDTEGKTGRSFMKVLMNQMGTTDVSKAFNVKALRPEGPESAIVIMELTPAAKKHMNDGNFSKEIVVRVTGTNVPEVAYNYAVSQGHDKDTAGKTEDAWLAMSHPMYHKFANKVHKIPSQPSGYTDDDKSFSDVIFAGNSRIRVTNMGVTAGGQPQYKLENVDTGVVPTDSYGNVKYFTADSAINALATMESQYEQNVLNSQ